MKKPARGGFKVDCKGKNGLAEIAGLAAMLRNQVGGVIAVRPL